jgi:hypothetical protein
MQGESVAALPCGNRKFLGGESKLARGPCYAHFLYYPACPSTFFHSLPEHCRKTSSSHCSFKFLQLTFRDNPHNTAIMG